MALLQPCSVCDGSGLVPDPNESGVKQACAPCCGTGYDFDTVVADKRLPNGSDPC